MYLENLILDRLLDGLEATKEIGAGGDVLEMLLSVVQNLLAISPYVRVIGSKVARVDPLRGGRHLAL